MEAEIPFETMEPFNQTSRCHIPEYSNPNETLKSKKFLDISASNFGPTKFGRLLWGSFWHLSAVINIKRTDKRYPVNRRNGIKIESAVAEQTPPCSAPHTHNKLHHLYVTSNPRQFRRGIPEEITERSPNKIKRLIFSTLFTRLVYTMWANIGGKCLYFGKIEQGSTVKWLSIVLSGIMNLSIGKIT